MVSFSVEYRFVPDKPLVKLHGFFECHVSAQITCWFEGVFESIRLVARWCARIQMRMRYWSAILSGVLDYVANKHFCPMQGVLPVMNGFLYYCVNLVLGDQWDFILRVQPFNLQSVDGLSPAYR